MTRIRKSRLYQAQKNMQSIVAAGVEYYKCEKIKNRGNTTLQSNYKYECDCCVHAVDRKGRKVSTIEGDEHMPKYIWCPFPECPYKEFYEEN